jgi:putative ABC transport system permease protein
LQILSFASRNALRSPVRGVLTVAAVTVTLFAYLLMRTVSTAWTEQIRQTPENRVVTRHKMAWDRTFPAHYVDAIRQQPGVKMAVGASWGNLTFPLSLRLAFEGIAVDAEPFVAMHRELATSEEQKTAFVSNRRGALVSRELANELGWQVGNVLHFRSRNVPGEIELFVSGIFQSKRHGFAQRSIYFHWDYFNEQLPPELKDSVNLVAAEVETPGSAAGIAQRIDMLFGNSGTPTFSQDDRATNAQLVGRAGAILDALDVVSLLVLWVVALILGNTTLMAVRERVREYGTLRAIGFQPWHVIGLVMLEGMAIGLVGGLVCLVLAFPLVEGIVSAALQTRLQFPPLHIYPDVAFSTVVLGALLGGAAAIYPAYQISSSQTAEALRAVA